MSTNITHDDLLDLYKEKIYTQKYREEEHIDGVMIVDLHLHVGEDGSFSEIARLSDKGELLSIPGFHIKQINRSNLDPQCVKAWHLHYKQDEVWYINPESKLLVGLLDVRKNSKSPGHVQRLTLGGGKTQLLFIPRGVAHGSRNLLNTEAMMWYLVNEYFDKSQPDEQRLPWDLLGADYWESQKD